MQEIFVKIYNEETQTEQKIKVGTVDFAGHSGELKEINIPLAQYSEEMDAVIYVSGFQNLDWDKALILLEVVTPERNYFYDYDFSQKENEIVLEEVSINIKNVYEWFQGKVREELFKPYQNRKPVAKVFVSAPAKIIKGKCAGIKGKLVDANSETRQIEIMVDPDTTIKTKWDNITQEGC